MSGKTQKKQADFSDLSALDGVTLVVNTAVVAKNSGHPVQVNAAGVRGEAGIMVFIPGYEMINGKILPVPIVPMKEADSEPE